MAKLDLDNRNVFQAEMTLDEARGYFDSGELSEQAEMALDEAQGHIHTNESGEAYVVIRIHR